jgi:predicted pyridoxine 5'-phosphate oxidase superfamily flavin-nucleotide-binding protein
MSRSLLRNGLHLGALSALAVAQPLFDILGRNPTFFAVRGSSGTEIVLFALALVLVPPAALLLVELAATLADARLGRGVHLALVAGLVGLLLLQALAKAERPDGPAALAAAALAGAAAAAVYARAAPVRSLATVLAPVPLVFLGLFLLHSPVSRLVRPATPEVHAATVRADVPVVMIVFDEFSTVGLMDRRGRVDARRFPHFAALAGDSTWYRSATTRYWLSEGAVPSLLTGRNPRPDAVPVYADYPRNVFTLLGGSYRVRAVESLTALCPRSICKDSTPETARAASPSYGSLLSDAGIVYLHLALPRRYEDRLPRIDDSWGDFGGRARAGEVAQEEAAAAGEPCARSVCAFTDLVDRDRTPTFYFLHSLLPHVPYVYLPSGKRYAVDARVLRGLRNGIWREQWPATQSQGRYLLQLAYTDRALGHIVRRLRETGVYSRALVIVTADHGVSFRVGVPRRQPVPRNLDDIAFVPLFVKLPGQTAGRVVDAQARTIDVVPTIAHVLGIRPPWPLDGKPLGPEGGSGGDTVSVVVNDARTVSAPLAALRDRRAQALAEQVSRFGTGSLAPVSRLGPAPALLGRQVAGLPVRPSTRLSVQLDDRALLAAVDPRSGVLPAYVEGKVKGPVAADAALAIAVNGRVAATTRTFRAGGDVRFSAFVPEPSLRPGANEVSVYAVAGTGAGVSLERLRDRELGYALVRRDGAEAIASGGTLVPIRAGALPGQVRATLDGAAYVFAGRARPPARRPVHTLVVFAGGRAVYWGRGSALKAQRILGDDAREPDAFAFELPRTLLPRPGAGAAVRVFAIDGGRASELAYPAGWPWPATP